jgi:hypothetical protein
LIDYFLLRDGHILNRLDLSALLGFVWIWIKDDRMNRFIKWLLSLVLIGVVGISAYTWIMLTWSYGNGERAGYVQKFSNRGYLCKTWEGELAMVSMPGTMSEKFLFTVREESVAQKINANLGKKVALKYEQHIGLPTSCFGDTEYFVSDIDVLDD